MVERRSFRDSKALKVESTFPSKLVAVYGLFLELVSEPLGGRS